MAPRKEGMERTIYGLTELLPPSLQRKETTAAVKLYQEEMERRAQRGNERKGGFGRVLF